MNGAPMIEDVQRLRLDIEEENDRLANELVSPSLARMIEFAIACESDAPHAPQNRPDRERMHISIRELTADSVALRPIHQTWLSSRGRCNPQRPIWAC